MQGLPDGSEEARLQELEAELDRQAAALKQVKAQNRQARTRLGSPARASEGLPSSRAACLAERPAPGAAYAMGWASSSRGPALALCGISCTARACCCAARTAATEDDHLFACPWRFTT